MSLPRRRRIVSTCDPSPGATSGYRLRSMERLGQEVIPFDITRYRFSSEYLNALRVRAPIGPLIRRINHDLLELVHRKKPDVVFFEKPVQFTRQTILAIRETGAVTVYFNQDNPFGPRNDPGWYQLRKVFRLFDLYCAIRESDTIRFGDWGLPWVRIMLSYEPSIHFPPSGSWSDENRSRLVSYIGQPYEERPAFLRSLAEKHNVSLAISGSAKWQKVWSPDLVARYVVSGQLIDDRYREEIWRSHINLSFLTHANEEDIAHKSVEIAACQGFLMALRCKGHEATFAEDKEAVFFSSVEECADKCRFYLNHPTLREAIARGGRERAVRCGYDNDTQLARVLNRLDGADV